MARIALIEVRLLAAGGSYVELTWSPEYGPPSVGLSGETPLPFFEFSDRL
jgi:hypothetical protein